jgi:predicted nucleotidyltransferase
MRPSEALALHRVALRQLLGRYGFKEPRVFGSVVTQTDTEDNNLDVLVEPQRPKRLSGQSSTRRDWEVSMPPLLQQIQSLLKSL